MDEFEDDFGDLYADVEVQASSAINAAVVQAFPELSSDDDDVVVGKGVSGGDGGDGNEKEEDEVGVETGVDDGSDSEDDLKIVLNSSDDGGGGGGGIGVSFPVSRSENLGGVVVGDEGEERDNCGGIGVPGLGLEGNGVNDKVENGGGGGGGGGGGERGNGGGKGGYHMQHSQYKYVRSQSAVPGYKTKENGCAAVSSYSYSSLKADREENGCGRRVGSGSSVAQSGNNFSLPRSRTILNVNIDIFERKPWRHPGADMTDFFNFGFDEESWKHYCNQLDEYRHGALIPTRVLPFESFKSTEAGKADNETMAHDTVRGKTRSRRGRAVPFSPSCEQQSEMQMGRAIQVEDSIIERKPSMDLRRVIDRDSDVIQINVQDSRENSSGTVKEDSCHEDMSLREISDNEGNGVDESGEFLCFSTDSEDELNSESLDGDPEGMDIPVAKRSSKETTACPGSMNSGDESHQISDVDGHHNQIVAACASEGTDGGGGTKNKSKEKAGGDTWTRDPSIVDGNSFQGEKSLHERRSSCSVSHSEAVEDDFYFGSRKSYCHVKRPSTNSIPEFRKSARPERYNVNRKPIHSRYRERHRSPVYRKLKDQFDYTDDIPLFDAEGLYGVHVSRADHRRAKERLPAVDSYYEGKDLSYQKECELPFDFHGERFSDYDFRDDRTEGPHRKGVRGFGAERDRFMFRNSNEGGDLFEEEISMMDEEMMAMDWYHYESRRDVEDVGPLSNQELEQLNFQYSSYLNDERGAPWNGKGGEPHFRRRGKSDEIFHDSKYSNDLRQGKYRRPLTYHDRDIDYLEHSHDRHAPYSRREGRNFGRNSRRFGSPVGLDDYRSGGDDDGFLRCRDDPSVSSRSLKEPGFSNSRRFHGSKMPRNSAFYGQGKHRRQWSGRFRDGVPFGGYYNDLDTEESINNFDDCGHGGRRRHRPKAERVQWDEGQNLLRTCRNKFHTEGAPFSFQKTFRRKKIDDLHESDHVGELIDDMHVNGGGIYKQTREGDTGYQFDRTPNIIQSHEQTLLSCEDSVVSDLVVVEGKFSGKLHERLEKKDQNVDAEQKTRRDSNESVSEMAAQVYNPEIKTNQNDEKWLDKFPVTQDNEALDIEEGQIIAEDNPETKLLTRSDTKEFLNQNRRNGKNEVDGYDNNNPRILEVMAKMEKRRERFKEPVSSMKDSDKDTVTNKNLVDSVGGTSMAKFQRPARKRRWGGRDCCSRASGALPQRAVWMQSRPSYFEISDRD